MNSYYTPMKQIINNNERECPGAPCPVNRVRSTRGELPQRRLDFDLLPPAFVEARDGVSSPLTFSIEWNNVCPPGAPKKPTYTMARFPAEEAACPPGAPRKPTYTMARFPAEEAACPPGAPRKPTYTMARFPAEEAACPPGAPRKPTYTMRRTMN